VADFEQRQTGRSAGTKPLITSAAIRCESLPEIDALFAALGENGNVAMPLQETFWASRFGVQTDQFGIYWMLNRGKPQPD
jgi:PhnB protein